MKIKIAKTNINSILWEIVLLILVIIPSILCLLPLIHVLAISLSGEGPANANAVGLWPIDFNIRAYAEVVRDQKMLDSTIMSLKRVLLGVTFNMVFTTLLAYPLSHEKEEFPMRNIYMWLVFFTMLFSGGLIPYYILIKQLNLMNTIWVLIFPGIPVFNVIIMMNFFRQLPKEIKEAAKIDGANHFTILSNIVLPLSLPVVATLVLFCFVGHWNEWFNGILFMNDVSRYPLQSYLQTLVSVMNEAPNIEEAKRMAAISRRSLLFARIFISMVPIMIVFPFLQKYYKSGLVIGSVKG